MVQQPSDALACARAVAVDEGGTLWGLQEVWHVPMMVWQRMAIITLENVRAHNADLKVARQATQTRREGREGQREVETEGIHAKHTCVRARASRER